MLVVIDFQVTLFVIKFRPISPIKSMILPLFIKVVHIVRNITTVVIKAEQLFKTDKTFIRNGDTSVCCFEDEGNF